MKRRFIFTILSIALSCIPFFMQSTRNNDVFFILNIIIIIICCIAIFSYTKIPYSIYKIVHIFILFFFSIAPVVQYKSEVRFMGTLFSDKDYIMTSLFVLGVLFVFDLVYYFSFSIDSQKIPRERFFYGGYNVGRIKKIVLLMLSFLILAFFLYENNFDYLNLIYRNTEDDIEPTSQILGLVSNTFFRGILLSICAASLSIKGFTRSERIIFLSLFILTNFPTGLARLTVAALYIPVALYCFSVLRHQNIFSIVIVISLLVVFPFLNSFRYMGQEISFEFNFDQFKELHFDAFSMFMRVLSNDIVTYGRQLLGVFLFWIPRALWPSKPIGSGAYIARLTGERFTNVSMPFFAEGYINGGLVGVILFTVVLGYFVARIDAKHWKYNVLGYDSFLYFLCIGLTMFIMRGDLLSSFAYSCGFIAGYYFVKYLLTFSFFKHY